MRALLILAVVTALAVTSEDPLEALVAGLQVGPGLLHADRVVLKGVEFSDVTGTTRIVDGRLRFDDIGGNAYGGRVAGRVEIDLITADILFDLVVWGADVSEFMLRFGGQAEAGLDGVLEGALRLEMPNAMAAAITGSGTAAIRQGTLVSMPLVAELLLGNPTATAGQDTADAVFHLAERAVHVDELVARGPSMTAIGSGRVGFDGHVDASFRPWSKPLLYRPLPVVREVLDFVVGVFSSTLGRMRLTGHVSGPRLFLSPF